MDALMAVSFKSTLVCNCWRNSFNLQQHHDAFVRQSNARQSYSCQNKHGLKLFINERI